MNINFSAETTPQESQNRSKMRFAYTLIILLLFAGCEKDIFIDQNNNPKYIFDSFWNELDRNYSFFTYTRLNWDSVYSVYEPKVTQNTSSEELFQLFSLMSDLLHDAHTNVYAPIGITGNINYFENLPVNQINDLSKYFETYSNDKIFEYGKILNSNIGYIKIRTFEGDNKDFIKIDTILNTFNTTKGLIIDVRSNRGGSIYNSKTIVSRFTDSSRVACKYRVRNGPNHNDFTKWLNMSVSPNINSHYNQPVVILTNRYSYSATEWFVLFADIIPDVTIVGDTTGGGSAIPLIRELPNGWLLRTSNTQTLLPSGRDFQFTGLYPDIAIWITPEDFIKNRDAILEKAISTLSDLQVKN